MSAAFAEVQDFLKALSNETRQQIVLGVFGDGQERSVNEVAEAAGIARRYFQVLRNKVKGQ